MRALILVVFGCSAPEAEESPPADRAYPPELSQWGYAPLETHFGYDPAAANAVYGHALTYDNLDPNGFADTPEGDAARRALGWLTTHPVLGDEAPMWMRVGAEPLVGPVEDRLASIAAGLKRGSLSLQSRSLATYATGAAQAGTGAPGSPKPSRSASGNHVVASTAPSSMVREQSSSMPLQTSTASGWTAGSRSLQSTSLL